MLRQIDEVVLLGLLALLLLRLLVLLGEEDLLVLGAGRLRVVVLAVLGRGIVLNVSLLVSCLLRWRLLLVRSACRLHLKLGHCRLLVV